MGQQVKFSRTVKFTGRNGAFKCTGIDIFKWHYTANDTSDISITPITSKGILGRCEIEVPIENLPAVIEILQNLVDEHKKKIK
jgi:hypothetical protein